MPSPLIIVALRPPTAPLVAPSLKTVRESNVVVSETKKFGVRCVREYLLVALGKPHSGAGIPGLSSVRRVVLEPTLTPVINQNRFSPGPSLISMVLPTRSLRVEFGAGWFGRAAKRSDVETVIESLE